MPQRPAEAASEEILPYNRSRLPFSLLEELIGIQNTVAEELERRPVQLRGSTLENRVDVASAITPLGCVIQAGLNLKLLHRVGTRQWRVQQLGISQIGDADSIQHVVVVVLPLAIDVDAHVAA